MFHNMEIIMIVFYLAWVDSAIIGSPEAEEFMPHSKMCEIIDQMFQRKIILREKKINFFKNICL